MCVLGADCGPRDIRVYTYHSRDVWQQAVLTTGEAT